MLRVVVGVHSVLRDHADGGDERCHCRRYVADVVASSEAQAVRHDPVEDELKTFSQEVVT